MYNTGNSDFLKYVCSPNREIDTYINLNTATTESIKLGTNDIVSYKLTYSSIAGKSFTPGGFVAGQLEVTLNAGSDAVNNINFKTIGITSIEVYAGISVRNKMTYVPMGVFYPEKDGINAGDDNYVTIKALDIPPALSNQFFSDTLSLPCTLADALTEISMDTNLPISIVEPNFPNLAVVLRETFTLSSTYREALKYLAEMCGAYISMGRNGEICFRRVYNGVVDLGCVLDDNYLFKVQKSEGLVKPFQYISIKANKDDLGVTVKVAGVETECIYNILNNPFTYGHPEDFLQGLVQPTFFAEFYPSKLSFQGRPDIDTGDVVNYTYKGVNYVLPICSHLFEYNGGFKTTVESVGSEGLSVSATDGGTSTQIKALNQNINSVEKSLQHTQSQITQINGDIVSMSEILQTMDALKTQVSLIEGDLTKLTTLTQKVDQLKIDIYKELDDGVSKVVTNTGFVFDDTGLEVSKTGSEMSTKVTEDGMSVFRDSVEVLKADHVGVKATNLHANTYLLIGTNSRLEDYGSGRTGLFWIGGNS